MQTAFPPALPLNGFRWFGQTVKKEIEIILVCLFYSLSSLCNAQSNGFILKATTAMKKEADWISSWNKLPPLLPFFFLLLLYSLFSFPPSLLPSVPLDSIQRRVTRIWHKPVRRSPEMCSTGPRASFPSDDHSDV